MEITIKFLKEFIHDMPDDSTVMIRIGQYTKAVPIAITDVFDVIKNEKVLIFKTTLPENMHTVTRKKD